MDMIIGVTGGIGSGKTTTASFFQDLGIETINADEVCRTIVQDNSKVFNQIVEHFGDKILTNNNELNRAKLREIIFSNNNERVWIENLLHPIVNKEMLQTAKNLSAPYCIIDSPLIIESNFHLLVDKLIVIDCNEDKQIERIMKRNNFSKKEVQKIIDAQLTRDKRLQYADFVITNNDSLANLKSRVEIMHHKLLKEIKENQQ